MDALNLVSIKQIADTVVPYGEETVRRYFNKGILYPHAVGQDGRSKMSHYGSVVVRYRALCKVKAGAHSSKSLDFFGRAFAAAAGEEDSFVMEALKKGATIEDTVDQFVLAVRQAL